MAATTSSACSSVSRTSGANGLAPDGIAVSAAVQKGSSAVGSRCTVPRGPYVFTSVRSSHSAARTPARVAPSVRRPTDSSAAESTCAWAPSMVLATSATGVPAGAGAPRNCRSARRALACSQVTDLAVMGCTVAMALAPLTLTLVDVMGRS